MSLVDFLVLGSLGTGVAILLGLIAIVEGRRRSRRMAARAARGPRPARSPDEGHASPDDDEITLITVSIDEMLTAGKRSEDAGGAEAAGKADASSEPPIYREPDKAETIPIVADPEAAEDEPTMASAILLTAAAGQTDVGKRRKHNEDRFAVMPDHHLYVVADGMGGYAGGEIASELACETITEAFRTQRFEGAIDDPSVPRRGAELALAIQQANRRIFERAQTQAELKGMGTTIVCARFAPRKGRVYIGHIGDSRCYRLRDGQLRQLTTDHTMGNLGVTGKYARHLSRAAGVGAGVKVDLIIAEPRIGDVYLLCSDGLTKMVKRDEVICEVLVARESLDAAVDLLVTMANEAGGKDNVTIVLVEVKDVAAESARLSLEVSSS